MNGLEEIAFIISVYAVYMFRDVWIDCGKRKPKVYFPVCHLEKKELRERKLAG